VETKALARIQEQEQSWQRLMILAQSGDERAYQELLSDLARVLRGYVHRKVGRESDVEDIVQEVLISIHRSRHTFEQDRPIGPWIFAIAKRRIIDHLRVGSRLSRELQGDDWDNEWWLERAGGDAVAENMRDLYREFQNLSEQKRQAVRLVALEGRSTRQAAEIMEMKESAFRVMFHRTVHSLRKVLVGESED
jgi:RNA polymerase sigma-70 factor (ECF subfamily)